MLSQSTIKQAQNLRRSMARKRVSSACTSCRSKRLKCFEKYRPCLRCIGSLRESVCVSEAYERYTLGGQAEVESSQNNQIIFLAPDSNQSLQRIQNHGGTEQNWNIPGMAHGSNQDDHINLFRYSQFQSSDEFKCIDSSLDKDDCYFRLDQTCSSDAAPCNIQSDWTTDTKNIENATRSIPDHTPAQSVIS